MHSTRLTKKDVEKLELDPTKDWWAEWPELRTAVMVKCDPTPGFARATYPIGAWHGSPAVGLPDHDGRVYTV